MATILPDTVPPLQSILKWVGRWLMTSPDVITLEAADRRVLEATARSGRAEHRQVCGHGSFWPPPAGSPTPASPANSGLSWTPCASGARGSASTACLGLRDRPRSGRPRIFAAAVVVEVKALACELPTQSEVPLARWSGPELAREAIGRGICAQVSPSTVRRWLAQDAIKPWQHRSWIFPRDPHFATKADTGTGPLCPCPGG